MAAVYDDALRHVDSLSGDLPQEAAATHIGLFFAWAAAAGLTSDVHLREHAEDFEKLTGRAYTGGEYVACALGGRLCSEHLNVEGQAFAAGYYVPGTYLEDYEGRLKEHQPTFFHVQDDWAGYERLAPVLDARLQAFRERGSAGVLPPAVDGAPAKPTDVQASLPSAGALIDLPPPPPSVSGARPVAQPPPLPPRAPKTPPPLPARAGSQGRRPKKKSGGSGKYWLLAIVLLFLAVKACGRLFDSSQRDLRTDNAQRWAEEVIRRQQLQQEHAERVHRQREARSNANKIRKARWAPLSEEQETEALASGLPGTFENALGMRFVLIPSGGSVMGSPGSEEGRSNDEELHNVEISEPFHLLTTEVSVALWSRYDETARMQPMDRSRTGSRSRPVTNVSFAQATAFCRWLEERDPERTYRLPTETEWEYACRAGTQERFWWGEAADLAVSFANVADSRARNHHERRARAETEAKPEAESPREWFPGDDGHAGVAVVGSYRANPWGLYDMLGNAREWCQDWYGRYDDSQFQDPTGPTVGTRRILRGGSCESPVSRTRCAAREAVLPGTSDSMTGFRVVSRPRR